MAYPNLTTLYKGKGDPKDPNNWRGIFLNESMTKIVSIIIANRLLKCLKQIGTLIQFEHIGCQEALHAFWTILMTRRHHGLEAHVLFIDLIKAFNLVNYEIMYKIITKYGVPDQLVKIIRKMHSICSV